MAHWYVTATTRASCSTSRRTPRARCWSPAPTSAPARRASTPSGPCRTTVSAVVLSPRFGDIFRGNAGKAGLLAAQVDDKVVLRLWDLLEAEPGTTISVDLDRADGARGLGPGRCRGLLRHRRLHAVASARGSRRHLADVGPRGRHLRLRSRSTELEARHALTRRASRVSVAARKPCRTRGFSSSGPRCECRAMSRRLGDARQARLSQILPKKHVAKPAEVIVARAGST